jgi:hypothetical protein
VDDVKRTNRQQQQGVLRVSTLSRWALLDYGVRIGQPELRGASRLCTGRNRRVERTQAARGKAIDSVGDAMKDVIGLIGVVLMLLWVAGWLIWDLFT